MFEAVASCLGYGKYSNSSNKWSSTVFIYRTAVRIHIVSRIDEYILHGSCTYQCQAPLPQVDIGGDLYNL